MAGRAGDSMVFGLDATGILQSQAPKVGLGFQNRLKCRHFAQQFLVAGTVRQASFKSPEAKHILLDAPESGLSMAKMPQRLLLFVVESLVIRFLQ